MKKTYYLFNPGRLSRKDQTLKFMPVDEDGNEQKPRFIPVEGVEDLYIFGSLDANASMYNFLGKNGVAAHFFDYYENYTGSYMPKDGLLSGKVLLAQATFHQNKKKRQFIASQFIEAGSYNILKNLKYYNARDKILDDVITDITEYRESIGSSVAIDELMGIEGNIRHRYYDGFDEIVNDFEMDGRSKQPPHNELNALISFGNMMCYSQCLRAIHQTQLNPVISFLHAPGYRRYSLALDLAEIFKPVIVDRVIFRVLNKKELQHSDFESKLNKIMLKEPGKKKFIQAMEQKLQETIQHKALNRKVSYKHLIRLECYKLVKHLMSIEEYKGFKMWW